jgi:CDP-diacylglycerol--glycerol-3-phosphate 3-phosphatidyltransferase
MLKVGLKIPFDQDGHVTVSPQKDSFNLERFLRTKSKTFLDKIAGAVNSTGILPNTITLLGLIGTAVGAIFLATDRITLGGVILLVMGPIDALDGSMARLRGDQTEFGAFVDSVTDRYSELVIFAGLLAHYLQQNDWLNCGLVFLAAAGSVMVSYVKARAEGLGFTAKVGVLSRLERYLVLIPGLILNIPWVSLWIIAIFANYTALQRILEVRRQAAEQKKLLTYPVKKRPGAVK